jgi:OmcA/MtrC family decaheme c-type cytochrome
MHAIHGSSKRKVPFTPASNDYSTILYPGILKNCNACHLPNTVNFATTGGTAVQPNLLWTYTADGVVAAPTPVSPITGALTGNNATSPWVTAGVNYGAAFTYSIPSGTGVGVQAATTTLVNTPISSACYACHDDQNALNHMVQTGGGTLHTPRGAGVAPTGNGVSGSGNTETCLTCHGQGTIADAAVVHQTQ